MKSVKEFIKSAGYTESRSLTFVDLEYMVKAYAIHIINQASEEARVTSTGEYYNRHFEIDKESILKLKTKL